MNMNALLAAVIGLPLVMAFALCVLEARRGQTK